MYEKILAPLDGSRVGEAALPYVEDLVPKLSPDVEVERSRSYSFASIIADACSRCSWGGRFRSRLY